MNSTVRQNYQPTRLDACLEIALIVTLFFVLAGTPPPDVNEAHYVAKAKHYWNPQWCAHDHFLNSADAHLIFYWTFGWLTLLFDLPTVTWIGRGITWLLLAWSWRRLSITIVPYKLYSVLTAALFATLMRWGHMAGEWVIGGVEAKGFAYVLIWLAFEAVIRDRWRRAIVMLGAASAFHVIAGGWSLVCIAIAWLATDRQFRPALREIFPALILSAVLAMFGLIPGLALSWSTSPETVREANRIYVFERLSHHLLFHNLPHIFIARHALLLLAWLGLWYRLQRDSSESANRFSTLSKIVFGAVVIAAAGIVLDQSLLYFRTIAASILRFYWFRLSDVMLPVGVTFGLACWVSGAGTPQFKRVPSERADDVEPTQVNWLLAMILLIVSVSVGHVVYEHLDDPRPGAVSQSLPGENLTYDQRMRRFEAWTQVCAWIEKNTPTDAVFLTPRQQQTFQWYAARSEVVSAKNFPQDAAGIIEWRKRLDDVFPRFIDQTDFTSQGEDRLIVLARRYSFQYILLDRSVSPRRLRFPQVYPAGIPASPHYEVYLVPGVATTKP